MAGVKQTKKKKGQTEETNNFSVPGRLLAKKILQSIPNRSLVGRFHTNKKMDGRRRGRENKRKKRRTEDRKGNDIKQETKEGTEGRKQYMWEEEKTG